MRKAITEFKFLGMMMVIRRQFGQITKLIPKKIMPLSFKNSNNPNDMINRLIHLFTRECIKSIIILKPTAHMI